MATTENFDTGSVLNRTEYNEDEDYDDEEDDDDSLDDLDFKNDFRLKTNNDKSYKAIMPSLADDLKIGFFSQDRCTQTTVTEILDMQNTMDTVEDLVHEVTQMKKDVYFAKKALEAEFGEKLSVKSIDLYSRINDRLAYMKKEHDERVQTIRRAYRQQLIDALARIGKLFSLRLNEKLRREKERLSMGVGGLEEEISNLKEIIQRHKASIELLQMDNDKLQSERDEMKFYKTELSRASYAPKINQVTALLNVPKLFSYTPSTEPDKAASSTGSHVQMMKIRLQLSGKSEISWVTGESEDEDEENAELLAAQNEIASLQDNLNNERKKNDTISTDLKNEKEKTDNLKFEVDTLKREIKQAYENIKNLKKESESGINNLQADLQSRIEQLESEKAAQAKAMEEDYKLKLEKYQKESKEKQDKMASEMKLSKSDKPSAELEKKITDMEKEMQKLQQLLAQERQKIKAMNRDNNALENERILQDRLRNEVVHLKKEMDKMQKSWEKKFAIMKQSMHALKDESYLRQNLQKQAANLHQASISYAIEYNNYIHVDTPAGIMPPPKSITVSQQRRQLPPVNSGLERNQTIAKSTDMISYTASAHSDRRTDIFSRGNENQILSDDEEVELPDGVVPIDVNFQNKPVFGTL